MIQLFDHNQKAYESAVNLLSQTGKAAIIHPTGTGKSFIAFKLTEENTDKSFVWLSPSEKIYSTQLENLKKASGFTPANIHFFTYARLMSMSDAEIVALYPDYIILDEFHRAGAPEWGKNVRALISSHPEAKLLGLSATNIRYLDNQRDMADELFDNRIADQMSLAEAITRKILPAPKYVVSFYAYELEEENYRRRMYHVSAPVRRQAEVYLEKLRHAIDKAEGLENIFQKHMQNKHGKYIVFCSGQDHMREMMEKSAKWFSKVDEHPHCYCVWSDSSSAEKDYKAFKDDDSDHLRLLYCIDMFNEGVHVEDLSGVILFRPTGSPIIYKQQIGRALSAIQSYRDQPIIFDIVNNFENLSTISSIEEEMWKISNSFQRANTKDLDAIPFQIIDEVRECRELFTHLEDTLSHSWEMMYQEAKTYYKQHGNLQVPKRYKTAEGYSLGTWILTQRKVRKGAIYGVLTEERICLLDQIGMVWQNRTETSWETGFEHAKAYKQQFGDLNITSRYISPDGYTLGRWIGNARQKFVKAKKNGKEPLSIPELRQLDDLGMIWEKSRDAYQQKLKIAKEYLDKYGNIDAESRYVTEDGFRLGDWLTNQRIRKKRNATWKKTEEELAQLEALGMRWKSKADCAWEKNYMQAKEYFEANHHLLMPCNYTVNQINLGKWICRQREHYKDKRLTSEQITRLESIGMEWISPFKWNQYYSVAKLYYQQHHNLNIPADYITEGILLGRWLTEQRKKKEKGIISEDHLQKLNAIHFLWNDKEDSHWDKMFLNLEDWIADHPDISPMPKDTKAEDGTNLYTWTKRQRIRNRKGQLRQYQQQKWNSFLRHLYCQKKS